MKLPYAKTLALLQEWNEKTKSLRAFHEKLSKVLMIAPESPVTESAWGIWESYTETLAKLTGAPKDWLDWFAIECQSGKSPKNMTFSNEEELLVVGIQDLMDAMFSNPDGTRNHDLKK